jgi:formylglycine-generating enzyme required for sulfatase activity
MRVSLLLVLPLGISVAAVACASGGSDDDPFLGGSDASGDGAVGDGSEGGAGVCKPGQTQCSGNQVQLCASGAWASPIACSTSACTSGACSGSTTTGASCSGKGAGIDDCPGGKGDESCCTSLEVPGGTFYRSYDGVSQQGMYKLWPASISGLRLDKYDVTVGRFRSFVAAVDGGWAPKAGSGIHTSLNGGQGLASTTGGYESGWDASWASNIATKAADWNTNLECSYGYETWTPNAGAAESLPINCVSWYEAYAFCIWDGGYLPSEAEWNFAAAGGSEQRVYPWSSPPSTTTIDCTYADFNGTSMAGCGAGVDAVGSQSPKGDGKWGQADLAGNLWNWTLDYYASNGQYAVPCDDCADTAGTDSQDLKARRGGAFYEPAPSVLTSVRGALGPADRNNGTGIRCARAP